MHNSPLHPINHVQQPHHPHVGGLHVIFGPMFSGKTLVYTVQQVVCTELIRRCKRYEVAKYKCAVVKYAKDDRYTEEDAVATHDRQTLNAIPTLSLLKIYGELMKYEVIGIDEGQFFPDIVEVAEKLANAGKTVIVAALDGTFQREAFGGILNLVPKAESVIKLRAVCMRCFKDAAFTKRMTLDTTVSAWLHQNIHKPVVELIGGTDKYTATCRACHPAPVDAPLMIDESVQTPQKVLDEIAGKLDAAPGVLLERVNSQKNLFGNDAENENAENNGAIDADSDTPPVKRICSNQNSIIS